MSEREKLIELLQGWGNKENDGVRALNKMCREKRIKIDYSKRNFEDIWNGIFVYESGK